MVQNFSKTFLILATILLIWCYINTYRQNATVTMHNPFVCDLRTLCLFLKSVLHNLYADRGKGLVLSMHAGY